MLMDERQIALNDIIEQSQESADLLKHHAERYQEENPEAATLFSKTGALMQEVADFCASVIRKMGELPRAADPEKEALDELLESASASIGEGSETVIRARSEANERLVELLKIALGKDLDTSISDTLKKFIQETESANDSLLALLED